MTTDVPRLHRLCAGLWPAAETEALGSWTLRADPSTTKRANSLDAFAPSEGPPEAALAAAAAWYRARGKRPLAQIRAEARPAGLEAPFSETCVMTIPLPRPAASWGKLRAESAAEPPAAWALIEHHGAEDFPARLAILRRLPPERRRFVTLCEGEAALGVAWVAAAADLALIAAVSVRPEARGRGLGRALMGAALEAAAGLGADLGAVQVEAENARARRLYESLGFREAYRYAYAEILA